MTPDVNVLVAADRREHMHHAAALPWLSAARRDATRVAPLILLPAVAVGYVRVVTDRRIFPQPTPLDQALGNVAELLAGPGVRLADLTGEWPRVADLCRAEGIVGPRVSDVWIAGSVLHLNEHLVTFDRGFRRLLPPRHLTVLTA